jgi:CPA1 family monovalent cation:H+ antiporter
MGLTAATMAFGPFELAAAVVTAAAFFGYINYRYLRFTQTAALTAMGGAASILVLLADRMRPEWHARQALSGVLTAIDFPFTLMQGMLSFLLFAAALHINLADIRRSGWTIAAVTASGVLLSTLIIGSLAALAAWLVGHPMPLAWCFLFGALISPTDPVAVLAILKRVHVPPSIEATVGGESLFNDGIAIVVVTILVEIVVGTREPSIREAAGLFAAEAGGGALLGLGVGWLAFRALCSIDEHNLEVLITLSLVMGGYALAQKLQVSGPIATAVAGLIIGNHGRELAMSDTTRDYVNKFWSLIDELLNAVLFLLIGLEVVLVLPNLHLLWIGVAAIPLSVAARAISVAVPLALLPRRSARGIYAILVIGGVRGGISMALALSVPDAPEKAMLVAATYLVVLFSVLVQAPVVAPVAKRLFTPR